MLNFPPSPRHIISSLLLHLLHRRSLKAGFFIAFHQRVTLEKFHIGKSAHYHISSLNPFQDGLDKLFDMRPMILAEFLTNPVGDDKTAGNTFVAEHSSQPIQR